MSCNLHDRVFLWSLWLEGFAVTGHVIEVDDDRVRIRWNGDRSTSWAPKDALGLYHDVESERRLGENVRRRLKQATRKT